MTLDQLLLAVLVAVTIANITLVVAAARGRTLARSWRSQSRQRPVAAPSAAVPPPTVHPATAAPGPTEPRPGEPPHRRSSDTFPPDLTELIEKPATVEPSPDGRDGARPAWPRNSMAASASQSPRVWMDLAQGSPRLGLDATTSLETAAGWSRIMEIENARLLRYRRPVTIVVAEIEGIKRLVERVGSEPVDRLLPVVADAFRKEARGSDWIARIADFRFAVLMSETDEIQAINYVERVRLCCEPWLASAAVPLRLAMGWASPPASGDLEFAVHKAEERMHGDRRVVGKPSLAVRSYGPRVVSLPARPVGDEMASGAGAEPSSGLSSRAADEPHTREHGHGDETGSKPRRHGRRDRDDLPGGPQN